MRRINGILLAAVAACVFAFGAAVSAMDMSGHGGHAAAPEWTKKDDADFLFGMIAHHRGALAMAEQVKGKTADRRVLEWADDIVKAQQKEIMEMEAIARETEAVDSGAGTAMAREMDAMLANPVSNDPGVNFVRQMIPHHAGAIAMALPALTGSDDPRIRKLAKDIIEDQAEEIHDFRKWLDRR